MGSPKRKKKTAELERLSAAHRWSRAPGTEADLFLGLERQKTQEVISDR